MTVTNVGVAWLELDEDMTGIWLHQSGGLNNDEDPVDVDGSNENVEDDVLLCLKIELVNMKQYF